ncbi:hypothetical protein FRC08_011284 [Ceratobasidium sp. 394]|nr:hypothetical protein FRC08_011284 [Ceratobasidium sp. 394]
MAKRKVGNYELSDSEDEAPPDPPPAKKARTQAVKPAFKMPLNALPPRSTATPRSTAPAITPNRGSLPTPRDTPGTTADVRSSPSLRGDTESRDTPVPSERSKGKQRDIQAGPSSLAPVQPKRLSYERELHEVGYSISGCVAKLDDQEKEILFLRKSLSETDAKVAELSIQFDRYKEAQATRWAEASLSAAAAAPAAPAVAAAADIALDSNERTHLTVEQAMMPNLGFDPRTNTLSYAPVSDAKVIADALASYTHRKKDKKPSYPAEGKIKKHVRESMFGTLDNVNQASDIKPPYFRPNGTHDLFPAELADPETGHVSAYPDWTKKIGTQVPFVERFLQRFRSSAPQNNTDYSVLARTIREEIIIEILLDGPWKTCVKQWHDMTNNKPDVVATRVRQGRRYKRRMAKAAQRREGRAEVPELAGKEYDALFHEAMMSEEESEEEGSEKVLVVKRPTWRSSYVNVYYDASAERTRQQRVAVQGNSFQPLKRKVQLVDIEEIPNPQRKDEILPIPLFAFSKQWRAKHKALVDAKDPRFDIKLAKPPKIDNFLIKYQPVNNDAEEDQTHQPIPEQPRADVADGDEEEPEDGAGDVERAVKGDEMWLEAVQDVEDEEAGEEHADEELDRSAAPTGADATLQAADGRANTAAANIQLDPAILEETQAAAASIPQPATLKRSKRLQLINPPAPAPSSSIIIQIPPFKHVAPKLPSPYPDNETEPLSPTDPTGAEMAPTTAESAAPIPEVQMPPGGPLYPPPLIQNDAPHELELATQPKSKKGGETGGGETAAGTGKKGKGGKKGGETAEKGGKGGKGGRGGKKGQTVAAAAVPGPGEGSVAPAEPKKRGRPRKNPLP